MKVTRPLILLVILFSASACSVSRAKCRSWQLQGDFFATVDSCSRCVEQLGDGNKDAVMGCALGLDAAKLMQPRS